MKKLFYIFLLLFSISTLTQAQSYRTDKLGFGLGPSVLYGDNTGIFTDFRFKVLPAVSVDYNRFISTHFDIRGTLGWQMIGSGDFYNEGLIQGIASAGYPHAFKGSLIYGDVMPVYHINPDRRGFLPSLVKVYTGLGVGFFHSLRKDERRIYNGAEFSTETYNASNTNVYIPFRVGAFVNILEINGDLGVEGTLMVSPFGNMEGNSLQQKRIKSDIAAQFQVTYRYHLY